VTTALLESVQRDQMAISVAQALASANAAALERGRDPQNSLVTITSDQGDAWRIQYGPRDYVSRRGGDLIVIVDAANGVIRQILRGQ
jgi:hypothetical protein